MDMSECPFATSLNPLRLLNDHICLPHPHEELIILQPPAPVLVAHPVQLLVMLARYQKNTSYEGGVVILGVQLIGGNVDGTLLRIFVEKVRVLRKKINIMHCYVITGGGGLLKTNIDQVRSVEPELVRLVDHPNFILNCLIVQKCLDMWNKL